MRAIHHGGAALGVKNGMRADVLEGPRVGALAEFGITLGVPTRGPFGGEVEERDGVTVERAPAAIVEALRAGKGASFEPPREVDRALRASFVTFEIVDTALRYAQALAPSLASLASSTSRRADALDALHRAARLIEALHATSRAHGELGLGAEGIRVDAEGAVTILVPASRLEPGALLTARLRSGASASVAAFSAPEVVTGYEAGAPADVYALAAIAHEIVTGRPPLGQIDFAEAQQGPFAALARVIARALSANEAARPDAAGLATALASAASEARRLDASTSATPYRGASSKAAATRPAARRPTSSAEATDREQQASSMSSILVVLLSVGGLFVFTGAVWLVSVTWAALAGSGRFVLLLALTSGVWGSSLVVQKRGYTGSAQALRVLGLELLWADGGYLLDVTQSSSDAGAWSALAAVMTALAFVAAGYLDSAIFAILAAIHYLVLAVAFGVYIHSGSPTGPATYPLLVGVVSVGIAFVGHRWRGGAMGFPFAGFAMLTAFASAIAGLALSGEARHELFGSTWPYVVAALAAAAALIPEKSYRSLAAFVGGAILAVVPTSEALIHTQSLGYLIGAVAVGFALLWTAFLWDRLGRDATTQTAWVVVGLTSAVAGPSLLFVGKCWGRSGLDALTGPDGVYLLLVVGVSAALVVSSYVLAKRAREKLVYRLVEMAALAQIFGTFTLQSLGQRDDVFYPLSILGLGAACLAVGATTRHATLVLLASSALLLNLAIQFFAKLWDVFPASLLVLVFGLSLLAAGVLYEKSIKHLLPTLKEWA